MMLRNIMTFMTVISLCACSQYENMDIVINKNNPNQNETISINEALMSLENVLEETSIKTKTTLHNISPNDIFVIGAKTLNIETRSDEATPVPDTLLYALNFEDGGFSILSANTKLNSSVLCITEYGEITPECIMAGLSLLEGTNTSSYSTVQEEEIDKGINIEAGKDYLYSLLISNVILDYFDNKSISDKEPTTKESIIGPIGPLVQTKWGPQDPIDKYQSIPGCGVIAAGQIMACNEYPSTSVFSSVTAGWSIIKTVFPSSDYTNKGTSYAQDQVARFIEELANSDNCDVASDGSVDVNNVRDTFRKYGYNVTKRLGCGNGDIDKITEHLIQKKSPIYMRGQRQDNFSEQQVAHAWIIDGLSSGMFHINWGWNGDADGYYAKGIFDTASLNSFDSTDTGVNTYVGYDARDYYHYFRILLITEPN